MVATHATATAAAADAGVKLSAFAKSALSAALGPSWSGGAARRAALRGELTLNGARCGAGYAMRPGDVVSVALAPATAAAPAPAAAPGPAAAPLRLLEPRCGVAGMAGVAFVWKPAGVATRRGPGSVDASLPAALGPTGQIHT